MTLDDIINSDLTFRGKYKKVSDLNLFGEVHNKFDKNFLNYLIQDRKYKNFTILYTYTKNLFNLDKCDDKR